MQEKLNSEDKQELQIFVNQANRLSFCKFFKNGRPKMALNLGDELTKARVPERQEFIEMLTILRPFIMSDDDIYFNKIVSKVRSRVENDKPNLKRLNSVHDRFKFYTGEYDDKKTNIRKNILIISPLSPT